MAGAVGIVFGLCVLSFTLGAALMYVVLRRREDAGALSAPAAPGEPVERTWRENPAAVEPVADDYDSRPIHRNPVAGLPQLEPMVPPPAGPQPVEHTTWVEREDFRQRYLRTFEEVRRKADSN